TLNQVGSSTLVGDVSGTIISTIDAATNSELIYELVFNKSSNVSFNQNTNLTHTIVSGEVFSIIIGPSSKNITLLDPDNILLVDSNFDGIYETDVNFFSASEIRYKYNPNPNGTTPFKFVANTIDQITFKHTLSNITDASTFSGVLSLTCFAIDTDNDGIADAFDLDSDNDGIPDVVEVRGTTSILSVVDNNGDGLYDVFDSLTTNDTDNDGVKDYLDLDSDNDGIFDVIEAGHGLIDADFDGRIDDTNVGSNGSVNALETSPDNFILAYTIANTDSDSLLNFNDLDSDLDGCNDVIEAGFTDPNGDGLLGNIPLTVNTEGRVTSGTDGYTTPNANYITAAPIVLNTAFEHVEFCEASTSIITIDSTADSFQWELSTDGINWTAITDNAIYSGATTTSLQITNIQLSFTNYEYRVFLQRVGNSCNETSNEIKLSVSPLPIVTASVDLKQCDNDTDGFSNFNLFEASSKISTNYANETFVFYPTLDDANADTAAYTINEATAFTNRNQTTDTVWVRTISDFGCYRVSEVNLTVSTTGIPATFQQRIFTVCDDFADIDGNNTVNNDDTDGVATFDFSSVTEEIRGEFPPSQLLIITYYRNEADALAEEDAITDPSSYRNIGYANSQQIYVRVDSQLDNDCLGFGAHITLNVEPVPTSTKPDDLELCDDFDDGNGTNGIIQTFDLSSQTATILDGQNPANFTVSYHLSAGDANTGANPIVNPSTYENTTRDQQRIYVRVANNSAGCFTDHVFFDLIVHPLPVANFVEDLQICDDDTDGSARNGFSQSFDLELQTAGILGTQDPANYTVTYHSSLSDAQNNLLPLGSPFTNTVVNRQTIYVRVFNETSQCANGISNFDVIVNPEPFTEIISNLSYCDDDNDQDDTNGIVQQIDLDNQILPILGTTQNEADFKVTFHLSSADASSGDNALSSPFENTIADQQTIFVRVEDLRTGCVNDDLRFDIIINPLPSFEVVTPRIVCLNGPELKIGAEIPGAVYTYEWLAPDGTITTDRTLVVISGGLYSVTATTTDGTGCSRTRTIQVNESIIATITEEDITVIDDSDNNSISIDTSDNNLGIGDYEFALLDAEGTIVAHYQDEPLFEGLDGGIYRVLVRDKNGCGLASVEVPVVTFPKFFTPNNDGYNDTWSLKGVNTTFFPTSKIYIFDRYGKVVADIPIGTAWDGTYGGKRLPSNDYWFNVILVDSNGNTRRRTGNFSLLRK
ncbi:MAG: T9SS type B sorting domain-containing protein, partial [Flavobacteriaceae bacterium]|nr:T9SS type B sorting domain-containing protein [Flavobacteriaceae bacterium]